MEPNKRYRLRSINNEDIALRFSVMGILPGKEILVRRTTFTGSTVYIEISNKVYGLTKKIFDNLDLEPIE